MKKSMKIAALFAAIAALALAAACMKKSDPFIAEILNLSEHSPPAYDNLGEETPVSISAAPFAVDAPGATIEEAGPGVLRLRSSSGHLAIGLEPGEAIYGLTERIVDDKAKSESHPAEVGGLDRRGEVVTMWVVPTISGYAPFYISSRGYGLLVEGTWPGQLDIGASDPDVLHLKWHTGEEGLSCLVIQGPSYTTILDRYTKIAGRPVLPPEWVFSPLKWRNQVGRHDFAMLDGVKINAEVADDILMYEELGFPKGMYMIDRPWAKGMMGYGNYDWDPKRFPNGDEMVKVLHERGWRVIVWGAPWAIGHRSFEFGPEARSKGYVIGSRCIDYTNPAAFKWHVDKIAGFVGRSGIDGWKLDRSEEYNPSRPGDIYYDGRTGVEVHNDYPRMYIRAYYEGTGAAKGDDFVLIPRASYTGSQKHSIVWGGDTRGSVKDDLDRLRHTDLGLRSVIISLQRMAFMGYPVWGSDTGGYIPFSHRDVFARWLEFSCFCPLMEIGGDGPHEPWNMPTEPKYDEEMIDIYRRYTWLHVRLQDYTYDLARRAHETGDPIVHPLVFDWPGDPAVKDMWDEYMYGPALLVAPVWRTGDRSRQVYLPKGEWTSLWDPAEKYSGPTTINVDAPLDSIPVFVLDEKAGMLPDGLTEGL